MEETATGMKAIVDALNTGLSSSTMFATFAELVPWIITLVIASLALYYLRKLIKGAAKGKVRI